LAIAISAPSAGRVMRKMMSPPYLLKSITPTSNCSWSRACASLRYIVARSVTMMPTPSCRTSSLPNSYRNRARASEIIEIIESLARWLAELMSVTRTVRCVA
jgi:hypothetical protein